uniref:Cofactor required for Sp1 transcriptional activation subunit 6 n=1 Tax=Phallusia mammillata TaxID=59560 RepID=A0A6F9DKR5_9ASCI|nr:mediator of RNA polymerase II transcription subunit 17-like [Phallusia mammillata]
MSGNPPPIKISLQSLSDTKIQEIAYDGRETFIQPLSMSESLTDLANRIDFLAENEDEETQTDDATSTSVDEAQYQAKQWPWENIRTQIQRSVIEMNVLTDVLSIAQNKPTNVPKETAESSDSNRYMMYDFASKEAEPSKQSLQMITKKRCLGAASKILLSGADRLNKAKSESSFQNTYHSELLKLRQRWRVRRVGEKILGELSFRTAGSDYWHMGSFEVIKKSDEDSDTLDDYEQNLTKLTPNVPKSPIKVVVSSDLRGFSSLSVQIMDLSKDEAIKSCTLSLSDIENSAMSSANDPLWHRVLCNAQNVLFCRELFARLSKEAVQQKTLGTASPIVVIGDTITTNIFPKIQLRVQLLFSKTHPTKRNPRQASIFSIQNALMHLLLRYFSKRLHISPPHPTTAALGLTTQMRHAAVHHNSLNQLAATAKKTTLSFVDVLITMSKHYEVRQRVCDTIKVLSNEFSDPDVLAHWSLASSKTESSARLTIANSGFESCYRSAVQVIVKPDCIKILQRDARSLTLSVDPTDLHNYFVSLVASHQLMTVQVLSRTLGWTMLHVSPHSSLGLTPDIKNRGSVLISSNNGAVSVAIACNEMIGGPIQYTTHVQYTKAHDRSQLEGTMYDDPDFSLESEKYLPLGGVWMKVNWPQLHGRHFIQKMETLLTSLVY